MYLGMRKIPWNEEDTLNEEHASTRRCASNTDYTSNQEYQLDTAFPVKKGCTGTQE